MSLNCSGFVYYSWKSLFIQNVYWDVLRGLVFFKNKFTYGMKSLSQHFDKEIYRYVHITWLLLTGKYLCWSLFLILSIAKFLRAAILKNICERLLLKMCSWNWENLFIMSFINFTLKNRFFNINIRNKFILVFHDSFPMKFVFTYNISLVWWEINSKK